MIKKIMKKMVASLSGVSAPKMRENHAIQTLINQGKSLTKLPTPTTPTGAGATSHVKS